MDKQKTDQEKIQNRIENLQAEVANIRKDSNQKGIKTRYRYAEGVNRFCKFLGENYKVQSFKNIRANHIYKYVEHMKTKGVSGKTMRTDLSGIRYIYKNSGGKRELPKNDKLDLPKNAETVDRSWNKDEVEMAKDVANSMGRTDVSMAITLSRAYGLRLEETVKCQYSHLRDALHTGELYVRGKNGQVRYVPLHDEKQYAIAREAMDYGQKLGRIGTDKILVSNLKGGVKTQKKSIQNWLANHRYKFMDNSREWKNQIEKWQEKAEKNGYRFKSKTLTMHGLRYAYAQERYKDFKREGYSDREARLGVSECLGHHREMVTKIYLAE